jgi:hypothetical protein
MSKFVLAGTAYKRNPDPLTNSGSASPEGLYPWSVFRAVVGGITANDFAADDDLEGEVLNLLLFTSDIPAVALAVAYDNTAVLQFFNPIANVLTQVTPLVVTSSGGTTSVTAADYGSVVSGYSGTGKLVPDVSGFLARVPTILAPAGGDADIVEVLIWANGAIQNAPVGPAGLAPTNADAGTSSPVRVAAPTPIILAVGDYTATIRDAGNIYTSTASGKVYQVVGLYGVAG